MTHYLGSHTPLRPTFGSHERSRNLDANIVVAQYILISRLIIVLQNHHSNGEARPHNPQS